VAGATYRVNIELNTEDLKAQLGVLDGMVSGLGKQKTAVSKEETKTQTRLNNLLNSNAVQYGRSLRLSKKGKDIEEEKLKYAEAVSKAMEGDFKAARELISYNRLSNTEKKNDLILNEKTVKVQEKSLKVGRGRAESIDALVNAQQRNFNLRTRIMELDRKGVNTYRLNLKYGELNTAQGDREFGTHKQISRELDLQLKKEERKWRWMRKQNQEIAKYARMGGAKSPVRGDPFLDVGSPAYNDRLAKEGGPSSKLNYRGGRLLPGPAGTGGRGGSSVWQSAAISGAFPLLFGQGPVTAAAGAIGGGLGAKFGGQMGGFAGGLAATSVAQQIGQAVNSVSQLGMALDPVRGNTDELVKAMGLTGTEFEKNIKAINTLGNKEAALSLARERMANLVGKKGVKALTDFGKNTARLASEWSKAMTQMGAAFAEFLEETGIVQWMTKKIQGRNLFSQAKKSEDPEIQRLWGLSRDAMLPPWAQSDEYKEDPKSRNEIVKEILERQKLINAGQDEASKLAAEQGARDAANLARVNDMYKQIGDTVKNGLVDGISAAIEGTKNLGEVASSVLKDIGRTILQYGINSFLVSLFPNSKTWGKIFGRASGGPVTGGDPYVVGEKGPELFVPNSSGNIVPNHAMGGSMVVNVDASGSSVEGDDDRSRQLGELIGAAVQSEIIRQQRPGGTLY
jgi:hypothetical protein